MPHHRALSEKSSGRNGFARGAAIVLLTICSLSACHRQQVGGQTLALVNGEPITTGDRDMELASLPPDQRRGANAAILQALIDRKLLAQDGVARGDDHSADFVRLERRWREMALAERDAATIAARATAQKDNPSASDADAALARHRAALRAAAEIIVAPRAVP